MAAPVIQQQISLSTQCMFRAATKAVLALQTWVRILYHTWCSSVDISSASS